MSTAPSPAEFRAGAGEHGTISMFTVIFALSVLVMAGLLVDGGLAIHARQRAADIAEQAARAAADQVDVDHLRRTGEVRVRSTAQACPHATALIEAYDGVAREVSCAVSADGARVDVTVEITVRLQLLSIVPGVHAFTMRSTASAHPEDDNGDL